MRNMNTKLLMSIFLSILCCLSTSQLYSQSQLALFDFSDKSAAETWISVNDGVMGGISEGNFRITKDKTLEFFGNLSLENNGGFTSIRTKPKNLNLNGYETISMRVKGDGRTYYINAMTSSRSSASSYRVSFNTKKDTWQEISVAFQDFKFTSFGRIIPFSPTLDASKIQSIGFTLADKKAGPFRLEIGWIKAEKATVKDDKTPEKNDIVDIAVSAGNFETLVAALKTAELVEALKGKGPLTVFAPTDEAFAKLPEGTVEDLLKPENRDKLIKILTYHVVPGKILLSNQSLETLQGQSLNIKPIGSFEVDGAKVVKTDIIASNGVIHIIDTVLIPPAEITNPKQDASDLIELAIKRGVPLFNDGQISACSAIYEITIESLLKSQDGALNKEDLSRLQKSLEEARTYQDNSRQKAWKLRQALDNAFISLSRQ